MTLSTQRVEQRRGGRRGADLATAHIESNRRILMSRALILLRLFESRRWVTYDDIREAFGGVCQKTATRWIRAVEDAGLPLLSERIDSASGVRSPLRFRLLRRNDR